MNRLAVLIIVSTLLLVSMYAIAGVSVAGKFVNSDFAALYTGAWIVRTNEVAQLYNPEIQRTVQFTTFNKDPGGNGSHFLPFINPPHVAFLLLPLSLLPARQAGLLLFSINCLVAVWAIGL